MSKILAFGEIMQRLTAPNNSLLCGCKQLDVCYGGSEANVLIALASFGNDTEYVTALPSNDLGYAVIRHLKSYSVGTKHIKMQGNVLGMYYFEQGFGGRANKVIYNRSNAEVSRLCEDDFDYDNLFCDCSVFHISGISFALSETVKRLCFRLLKEAKLRNITISFDFNYRSKLWSCETAAAVYKEIIPFVDVLFCSEKDLKVFLDTSSADFYNRFSCKYLIIREREILPDGKNSVSVCGYESLPGSINKLEKNAVNFPVLERIGSGDAFDAGVLHIISNGGALSDALDFGLSCFVLKHTVRGDVLAVNDSLVKDFFTDSLGDVSR